MMPQSCFFLHSISQIWLFSVHLAKNFCAIFSNLSVLSLPPPDTPVPSKSPLSFSPSCDSCPFNKLKISYLCLAPFNYVQSVPVLLFPWYQPPLAPFFSHVNSYMWEKLSIQIYKLTTLFFVLSPSLGQWQTITQWDLRKFILDPKNYASFHATCAWCVDPYTNSLENTLF